MMSINIIPVKKNSNTFFAYLLSVYLIAAREQFQILKNGSDYQVAWPPLIYIFSARHGAFFIFI